MFAASARPASLACTALGMPSPNWLTVRMQLPVGEGHLQKLLAVHGLSVLVLHLGDDLLGLHVDNIAGRKEGVLPVDAHRDPVGGGRRREGHLQTGHSPVLS